MSRTCVSHQVTPEQFIAVWKRFGLVLTPQLAAAFFDKYGRDARGLMPVMVRDEPYRPARAERSCFIATNGFA